MKKFWKLGAIALAALTLVACGQTKKSSDGDSKRVKITYWHRMTGSYEKALNEQIDGFNKSQDKYEVVGVSQGSYDALQQKIMAAAKSKTLPTLAQTPYTNIGDYVKNDFLIPFDKEMLEGDNKLSAKELSDIYPSFLSAGKFDGKYYGMPFSVSTRVLYYNQGLMDQLKLKAPKTWADVQRMAPGLKAKNLSAIGLDRSYDVELEGMAQQAGNKMITDDLTSNVAAPTTLTAANLLLDLTKNGGIHMAGADNYFTTPFLNGKVVFGISSSASIPVLEEQAGKDFKWGTTVIPSYNGKNGTALNGNDNVMFKGASEEQQKGAWLFQKYLLKAENTAKWAMKTGYVPVTKSGVESKDYQAFLKSHPYYQATVDAIDNSFASTVFPGYTDYRNGLMDAVDATLSKNVPATKAFTDLNKKTETILKTK